MKTFFKILLALILVITTFSCSKEEGCATDNSGNIIIENTSSQHNLHFYKSKSGLASNTPGDLIVEPGQKGSITLSAGVYTTLVKLFTGGCNGSRCQVSWEVLDDNKELDLASCEDLNLSY